MYFAFFQAKLTNGCYTLDVSRFEKKLLTDNYTRMLLRFACCWI